MPPATQPRTQHPDEPALLRIASSVRRVRGLDLDQYKRGFLRRRLAVRQRALGIASLEDYESRLDRDSSEVDALLGALTINVSEFFRNPTLFHFLETGVLPDLLEHGRARQQPLQVWSAGCASGEELYSVAIQLDRMQVPRDDARLLGTDIDREAIAAARLGVFDEPRLREVPDPLRERYFEPAGTRTFRVHADLLSPARFRIHDLLTEPLRRGLDLVLCRNVLIYFELGLQDAILERIAGAVRPGGILVLGRVERLAGALRDLFEPLDLRERVYRRTGAGASHAG